MRRFLLKERQALDGPDGTEKVLPAVWRPFHALTPILQAVGCGARREVLLSKGIPRGCVAPHAIHIEEDEEEGREGGGGGERGKHKTHHGGRGGRGSDKGR